MYESKYLNEYLIVWMIPKGYHVCVYDASFDIVADIVVWNYQISGWRFKRYCLRLHKCCIYIQDFKTWNVNTKLQSLCINHFSSFLLLRWIYNEIKWRINSDRLSCKWLLQKIIIPICVVYWCLDFGCTQRIEMIEMKAGILTHHWCRNL